MNKIEFFNQLDNITDKATKENLKSFVFDIASSLKENGREKFLHNLLKSIQENKICIKMEDVHQKLIKKIISLKNELRKISEGEYSINSEYDEYYTPSYSWDDDPANEINFEDTNKICSKIEKGFNLVHDCIDTHLYEEGYKLAKELFNLEIECKGYYEEIYGSSTITINELESLGLCDNVNSFLHDYTKLLFCYPIETNQKVIDLFQLYNQDCYWASSLLKTIKELNISTQNIQDFLTPWIDFLANYKDKDKYRDYETNSEYKAKLLLKEAIEMLDSQENLPEFAKKYSSNHPELYEQLLQNNLNTDKPEQFLRYGQEALKTVNSGTELYYRVIIFTAYYASKSKHQDEAESLWLEAFKNRPNLTNYLRLVFETRNYESYQKFVNDIIISQINNEYTFINKELFRLLFLEGNYNLKAYFKTINSSKEVANISETQQGIPLTLLFLLKSKELPLACRHLCKFIDHFSFEDYYTAIYLENNSIKQSDDFLWEKLNILKEKHPITVEFQEILLSVVKKEIARITETVTSHKNRDSYYVCAAYIAALGEVLESRGEKDAKINLINLYKYNYRYYTALRRELNAFIP